MQTNIKTIVSTILRQFAILAAPVLFALIFVPAGNTVSADIPHNLTVLAQEEECMGADCISQRLSQVARVLSAGVGVVIAIMAVTGGIQYITAGGNPQKVSAAKTRIAQAIMAMFLFIFGLSILEWLVPGTITP